MEFITICDCTGIIEREIFVTGYRVFGVVTIRNPIVEVTATVKPSYNQMGCTLRVVLIGKPRHG